MKIYVLVTKDDKKIKDFVVSYSDECARETFYSMNREYVERDEFFYKYFIFTLSSLVGCNLEGLI